MIYPLLIGTIMAMWKVEPGLAGVAATVTLMFSAVGGWGGGYLSDRIGRVRTLQITVLWFAVFSLLSAFAQNFSQLIICRALLGIGFGGTWAAGAVLLGEAVQPQYRGRAVGCVQSGWALGWGLAVLGQAVLFYLLPAQLAWRALFLVGGLPALLLLAFIAKYVEEPPIAVAARKKVAASGARPSPWAIFSPEIIKTTLLASLAFTGAQGGYYAINTWMPTFLHTARGLNIFDSAGYLSVLIAGSFSGFLTGAWLADRIGRRLLFLVFSAGAVVTILAYTQLPISNHVILFIGFPLGFFSSGYYSGMGPFLTELFPTRLRGSGQGFCYNFGRALGALLPTLVGWLSTLLPLAQAMAIFSVAAYVVFFGAAFALPETRGKVLNYDG